MEDKAKAIAGTTVLARDIKDYINSMPVDEARTLLRAVLISPEWQNEEETKAILNYIHNAATFVTRRLEERVKQYEREHPPTGISTTSSTGNTPTASTNTNQGTATYEQKGEHSTPDNRM